MCISGQKGDRARHQPFLNLKVSTHNCVNNLCGKYLLNSLILSLGGWTDGKGGVWGGGRGAPPGFGVPVYVQGVKSFRHLPNCVRISLAHSHTGKSPDRPTYPAQWIYSEIVLDIKPVSRAI